MVVHNGEKMGRASSIDTNRCRKRERQKLQVDQWIITGEWADTTLDRWWMEWKGRDCLRYALSSFSYESYFQKERERGKEKRREKNLVHNFASRFVDPYSPLLSIARERQGMNQVSPAQVTKSLSLTYKHSHQSHLERKEQKEWNSEVRKKKWEKKERKDGYSVTLWLGANLCVSCFSCSIRKKEGFLVARNDNRSFLSLFLFLSLSPHLLQLVTSSHTICVTEGFNSSWNS